MEVDPTLTPEERKKYLEEWYSKTEEYFLEEKLTMEKCLEIIENSNVAIRHGFDLFFDKCFERNIPFYILSGGISQVLYIILEPIHEHFHSYENYF